MTRGADRLIPIPTDKDRHFDWLQDPRLVAVMDALDKASPGAARFVGGCVRDSLFGAAPKDFDVATTLTPDAVMKAAAAARLKTAPTGVEHGTVTVIANHLGVEVTTLRADVSTDGRRATVAFTTDWTTDAQRRDFTMNAIYLTRDRKLFDPTNGLADIGSDRVAFIGDAHARIREDYLRILRFFRFNARFADAIDADGLSACAAHTDGLSQLSAERIGAEFTAILAGPRPAFALRAMHDSGALAAIWSAAADIDAVERLHAIAPTAPAAVGLAALYGVAGEGLGSRLRLSNAEEAIRVAALANVDQFAAAIDRNTARGLIYRLGKDAFADAAALGFARQSISAADYQGLVKEADDWTPPPAPFSGKDVLAYGVKPGPAVAAVLAEAENRWISENFPDKARAHALLAETIEKFADPV